MPWPNDLPAVCCGGFIQYTPFFCIHLGKDVIYDLSLVNKVHSAVQSGTISTNYPVWNNGSVRFLLFLLNKDSMQSHEAPSAHQ